MELFFGSLTYIWNEEGVHKGQWNGVVSEAHDAARHALWNYNSPIFGMRKACTKDNGMVL